MNAIEYAQHIPEEAQRAEGWLLVTKDDGQLTIERWDEDPEERFADDEDARRFVADRAERTLYVIARNEPERGDQEDEYVFWNNANGWGGFLDAEVYTAQEVRDTQVPFGGAWYAVMPNFGVIRISREGNW